MDIYKIIIPLGISTYISLLITIATGLMIFKFHVKWVKMKWHIWFAVLTVILATIHAGVVIFFD